MFGVKSVRILEEVRLLFGVKLVRILEEIRAAVQGEISPCFGKDSGYCSG